jgi:hypothetical protein
MQTDQLQADEVQIGVDLNEPLPRLLRLRGSLARSLPTGEISPTDAKGLSGSYERLRGSTIELTAALGVDVREFEHQFPSMAGSTVNLNDLIRSKEVASTAATLLRQLVGYVEGLIEALVVDQKITEDQMKAAREASRQPAGFT